MMCIPSKRTFEQAKKAYELHASALNQKPLRVVEAASYRTKAGTWVLSNGLEHVAYVTARGSVSAVAREECAC